MTKRILAQILILCMLFSVLPATAWADTEVEIYPYIEEHIPNSGQISASKTLTVIATSSDLCITGMALKAINVDNGNECIPEAYGPFRSSTDDTGLCEYKQDFVLNGDLKVTGGKWTFEVTSTYKLTEGSSETKSLVRTLPNSYQQDHWYRYYTIVDGIPSTAEDTSKGKLKVVGLTKAGDSGVYTAVTGADIAKIYDGTTVVPASLYSSWEVKFKDENGNIVELAKNIDYKIAHGEFGEKNAGNQTVIFSVELSSNSVAKGYSLSDRGVFIIYGGSILKKEIFIACISAANKIYDGKTDAYVTPTFSGLVSGEALTKGDYTVTASFTDANVGTNKLISYDITLKNAGTAKNYTLITDAGVTLPEARASITAKNVGDFSDTSDSAGIGGTVSVNGTADVDSGTAVINVSTSDVQSAVDKAVQTGNNNIVIRANSPNDISTDSVQVTFPVSAIDSLVSRTNASLTVITTLASITIPNDSLYRINRNASNFAVSVASLSPDTVHVALTQDGKDVGALSSGMKVEIPASYIPLSSGTVAVLINPSKTETVCPKSVITENGTLTVLLDTSSATISYRDNSRFFTDVSSSHWAFDAINFVSSHGLFCGTTSTAFGDSATMNRAMVVTVLHRLESTPYAGTCIFDDVPSNSYYAQAAAWASRMGIVLGDGSGFNGSRAVTRQEIALMLYRYVQTINGNKGRMGNYYDMTGANQVAGWADEAMQWAVGSGIIQGDNGNLKPRDNVTRAEAAQMIVNFIKLITQ